MKNLEAMLHDRMHAYTLYFNAMGKTHSTVGPEQSKVSGTVGIALDAYNVFIEQELQQSKQQTLLVDLKDRIVSERTNGRTKFYDYQSELSVAERNIEAAEKRLHRSREILEKAIESRKNGVTPPVTVGNKFTRAFKNWGTPSSGMQQDDNTVSVPPPTPPPDSKQASVIAAATPVNDQLKSPVIDETLLKAKSDVRDAIRNLLNAIETRDNIRLASRRAFYSLDMECKDRIADTLKQIVMRERESLEAREASLRRLEACVADINVKQDVESFCNRFAREEDTLMLYSQALLLIGNISEEQKKGVASWNPVEPSASDIATVVAAAHHASSHATDANTSQSDLASDAVEALKSAVDLTSEFESHIPEAIKDAVDSPLPETIPTPQHTLSRIQAEDLREGDSSVAEEPKYNFKQKYSDEPDRALSAESAYEMFHNIFYMKDTPPQSPEELVKIAKSNCPLEIENYGTNICAQEVELLSEASKTLDGRTILVLVLNQFRSKKVVNQFYYNA